jgi:hypothetical protein
MNVDKMIDALVQDDFDSFTSGDAIELLNSYLEFGNRGYRDYSEIELEQECSERGLTINDDEEEYDGQPDEMQEWWDFDSDC